MIALLALTTATIAAQAQAQTERPQAIVYAPTAISVEEAPPKSPAKSPGPLSLDACLELGCKHQPAVDAARASLHAAQVGQRGINKLIIPRMFVKDLPIRREQSAHGVIIAEAGLTQAEQDTRYAITRNFFTVQYIRSQGKVINEVLDSLNKGYDRAKKIFDSGDVGKITQIDLDAIKVQIGIVKGKKSQVDNGLKKAEAALREAMGVMHDYPLEVAVVELPPAVYQVKVKDKIEYRGPLYTLDKKSLIEAAIANRGEMVQAITASKITDLEVAAQGKIRGWKGMTFGMGADIHSKPIPQGVYNNEYRPYAIGIEMPPQVGGRMRDRVERASALADRASAVVDKTTNLVALDVEAQYLKWQEAAEEVRDLSEIQDVAKSLPKRVQELNPNEFTSTAIIQANITSIMVRTQLNEAMHMHALALAGLERATAGAFHVYPVPAAPAGVPK